MEAGSPVWGFSSHVGRQASPEMGALGRSRLVRRGRIRCGHFECGVPGCRACGFLAEALEQGRGQRAGLHSSESPGQGGPEEALGF